ncbi:hypothetical protein GCM10027062_33980 [Nocardioides hungaricus]
MRLNSKGQVTIPAALRHKHGFAEGDEVDVVEDGTTLRIVHRSPGTTRGGRVVERLRGSAPKGGPSTDELMELLRGD